MKVTFLIAGTQKGGTSALDAYLRKHPAVCMATSKELHFFDDETIAHDHPDAIARYHAHFHPRPGQLVVGEATPIYMYWRDAPRRIWRYNPSMRIVVSLRNPIERAYSHWNMERLRHADPLPFGEAIRRESVRLRDALPLQHRVFSYVDRGFYVEQLRRLWEFFPKEQVLILRQEELRRTPESTLCRVAEFLGVSPFAAPEPLDVHRLDYPGPMDLADRAFLRDIFEPEIQHLERLLGWSLDQWLEIL